MKNPIYPLYLVIDNSASMQNEVDGVTLSELAMEIPLAILKLYETDPSLVSALRVGVISFNIEANTILPLNPIPKLRTLPHTLNPGYRTYFSKVFDELAVQIRSDYESLSSSYKVMKPAVLIVTDGIPSDPPEVRKNSYEKLGLKLGGAEDTSLFPTPPQIIVLGVGEADLAKILIYDNTSLSHQNKIRQAKNFQEVSDHLKAIALWLQTHVSSSLADPKMDEKAPWLDTKEDPNIDNPWG